MDASAEPQSGGRGDRLLLLHCAAFERMTGDGPTAYERLLDVLDEELAALLVRALSGERPLRAPAATAA